MRKCRKIISGFMVGVLLAGCLSGCGKHVGQNTENQTEVKNLMTDIKKEAPSVDETGGMTDEERNLAMADFSVKLLKESVDADTNVLLSPTSIIYALAMTANGAEGETKKQLETLFEMDIDELNVYLYGYMENIAASEKGKLLLANAIWFSSEKDVHIKEEFLQTNKSWYDAEIYETSFDTGAVKEINEWVSEHTDGMIPEIVEKLSPDIIMCLINALSFEAEWMDIYTEDNICDGTFTNSKGENKTVQMMHSEEYFYIEDTNACGFIKKYEDGNYAFAVILPDEGMTLEEYIEGLDGKKLRELITNPKEVAVHAAMPKFETEYSAKLGEVLKKLGMTDAFSATLADFSGIGTLDNPNENIVISEVLHKTKITVDEKGTKAGAATAVMLERATGVAEIKNITLDRPFIYMIINCTDNQPVFIGTLNDVEK